MNSATNRVRYPWIPGYAVYNPASIAKITNIGDSNEEALFITRAKLTVAQVSEQKMPESLTIYLKRVSVEISSPGIDNFDVTGVRHRVVGRDTTRVTIEADVTEGDPTVLQSRGQVMLVTPEEYANLRAFGHASKPPGTDDLLRSLNEERRRTAEVEAERVKTAQKLVQADDAILMLNKKIEALEARQPVVYEAAF